MRIRIVGLLLLGALGVTACQESSSPDNSSPLDRPEFARRSSEDKGNETALSNMRAVNARLAARGLHVALNSVEFFTIGRGRPGNRLHTTDTRWVPNDPNRLAQGTDITYMVGTNRGATTSGLTAGQTEAAIDRAMDTWNGQQALRKTSLVKRAYPAGTDITIWDEVIDAVFGTTFDDFAAPGDPFAADIADAGWLPLDFFELTNLLFGGTPGDGANILAFTIGFIFVDENGNPTDLNGDNRLDTALQEVYYNDLFTWGIDVPLPDFDVETVALHENGHGLELGHFGPPPVAVMNQVYAGLRQTPFPSDLAGLRIIWGSWPNP